MVNIVEANVSIIRGVQRLVHFFVRFGRVLSATPSQCRSMGVFRFALYASTTLYYRYRHHRSTVLTSKLDVYIALLFYSRRFGVVVTPLTFDTIARWNPTIFLIRSSGSNCGMIKIIWYFVYCRVDVGEDMIFQRGIKLYILCFIVKETFNSLSFYEIVLDYCYSSRNTPNLRRNIRTCIWRIHCQNLQSMLRFSHNIFMNLIIMI